MDRRLLKELNIERRSRRAAMLLTDLSDGQGRLIREREPVEPVLSDMVAAAFRSGKSGTIEAGGKAWFLNVYVPPPRLVVVGAVHISQALAPMARLAGYDMEIIDPRTAFATPERFADVALHAEWPEDALKARPLDAYAAVAALTHDPKIDDFALKAALEARCFYVGALGSRKTHAKRVERLVAMGVTAEAIGRIDAPIGVDIAASSPAEIAVAVLAQIIKAFRTRGAAGSAESEAA
jgi:xanthine dehydrogenase accessory factor